VGEEFPAMIELLLLSVPKNLAQPPALMVVELPDIVQWRSVVTPLKW
jgi:hypothetical protein